MTAIVWFSLYPVNLKGGTGKQLTVFRKQTVVKATAIHPQAFILSENVTYVLASQSLEAAKVIISLRMEK